MKGLNIMGLIRLSDGVVSVLVTAYLCGPNTCSRARSAVLAAGVG